MIVLLVDDFFEKTRVGSSVRESVFEFLERTKCLPKFGSDYTVEKVINYDHGIQGYRLREIQGIFPDGEPITFSAHRFLILSESEFSKNS